MSTRSNIIVHLSNDKWHRIYCHWDGYLSHNGRILFDHYTSQEKAEALVALGDLSILAPEIGVKHPFDQPRGEKARQNYKAKFGAMCLAYGRDRGEKNVGGMLHESLSAAWSDIQDLAEFVYVWDEGKWRVSDPDEGSQALIDLGDALTGKKTLRPAVKCFGISGAIGQHAPHDPANPDSHAWTSYLK